MLSKKLAQTGVSVLLIALAGCAKTRPRAPTTQVPPPATNAARTAPALENAAPRAAPEPAPITASELDVLAPPKKWPVPKGKLDDARFIALSARYMAILASLPAPRRTQDNLVNALDSLLADEGLGPADYRAHAEAISRDPARKKKVGAEIVRIVNKRLGIKLGAVGPVPPQVPQQEAKPGAR